VGGAGISAAKVALTIAVEYADKRRQFEATEGEPEILLLDYGLHQRRLLPLLARTYALHFAQEVLAARLDEVFSGAKTDDETRRRLESRAAGTKALATWHATRTIQECREACGGAGYLADNRFAALKADTDVFTTFEGDNHVLLQLVAKGLLTDYASDFSDLDQLGMVRFVASQAVETVLERTCAHQLLSQIKDLLPGGSNDDDGEDSWANDADLRDPNYHRAMYQFREEHLISGVARRLRAGMKSDTPTAEVFSRAQDHLIAAARAHVERIVLDAFLDKIEATPEGPERDVLNLLADLHALSGIEADRAWFIEHGRLTVQRSKAITREVGDLCRSVRPIAGDLVAAFGVPREMLRASALIKE
jgi:acyl-CoA oxidase